MPPRYRTPEQVRALLGQLTGRPVDASVTVFPPFGSLNHGVDPERRGAVVTEDVPANAIVAGVPARLIRMTGFEATAD